MKILVLLMFLVSTQSHAFSDFKGLSESASPACQGILTKLVACYADYAEHPADYQSACTLMAFGNYCFPLACRHGLLPKYSKCERRESEVSNARHQEHISEVLDYLHEIGGQNQQRRDEMERIMERRKGKKEKKERLQEKEEALREQLQEAR